MFCLVCLVRLVIVILIIGVLGDSNINNNSFRRGGRAVAVALVLIAKGLHLPKIYMTDSSGHGKRLLLLLLFIITITIIVLHFGRKCSVWSTIGRATPSGLKRTMRGIVLVLVPVLLLLLPLLLLPLLLLLLKDVGK